VAPSRRDPSATPRSQRTAGSSGYADARHWEPSPAMSDRPYHLAADDAKHYGKPGGECNVVTWMDNDEELIEACIGALSFTIGRTPIEPVWTGDWYEWKPLQ
jgi:hypothetical protein